MPALAAVDDDPAPRALRAAERLDEVRRGEQHRQVGGLGVGVGDAVEELGADDAAAAPDLRDRAEVDVPVVLGGAGADLVEALRVRDDLRRVQGEAHVLDERVGVLDREALGRAGQVARDGALLGVATTASGRTSASAMPETGTPRFSAVCTVHAPVPLAPAWSRMTSTSGLPVSASTWRSTSAVISIRYDSSSPRVPLGEHVGDLGGGLAGAAADQVVRLGDELHVGVLDAVVHHLHEVAGAVVADVRDARLALGDRRDATSGSGRGSPRTRPSRRA